jgi:two-component system response regulator AtoC
MAESLGDEGTIRANSQVMTKNSPSLRVLVVDDELLIRWSIGETLKQHGHIVTEAADSASARRALSDSARPIDAAVLDYRLPDSNDLTLLDHVRRVLPDSPVVLTTAFGTPEVIQAALKLSVYAVMHKPLEMSHLEVLLLKECESTP